MLGNWKCRRGRGWPAGTEPTCGKDRRSCGESQEAARSAPREPSGAPSRGWGQAVAPAFPACCFEVFVFFPAARNKAISRGGGDAATRGWGAGRGTARGPLASRGPRGVRGCGR